MAIMAITTNNSIKVNAAPSGLREPVEAPAAGGFGFIKIALRQEPSLIPRGDAAVVIIRLALTIQSPANELLFFGDRDFILRFHCGVHKDSLAPAVLRRRDFAWRKPPGAGRTAPAS